MRPLLIPHKLVRVLRNATPFRPRNSSNSTLHDVSHESGGTTSAAYRARSYAIELAFIAVFGCAILATYTWDTMYTPVIDTVNLINFESIQHYEHSLSQHNYETAKNARYVRFVNQHNGAGFNNIWEEVILLNEMALRADRGFVFGSWVLSDGSVRPMNLMMSGPTAGGAFPSGWDTPRSISTEWYEQICPPKQRRQISSDNVWYETQLREKFDGEELVSTWAKYISNIPDRCIDVDGRGFQDLDFWFGSTRSLTVWPALSKSPIMTHHAWSAAVYNGVSNNIELITGRKITKQTERHPNVSLPPLLRNVEMSNVVSLHIRRGDYEGHCGILAYFDAPYAAWNALPGLPDTYKPDNSSEETKQFLMPHCLPTAAEVADRVNRALKQYDLDRPGADRVDRVYVMTNAEVSWINELKTELRVRGLHNVVTSHDLVLEGTGAIASQIVDMEFGIRAALFIGNGFSTFTSTVVALRLVRGAAMHTNRFW